MAQTSTGHMQLESSEARGRVVAAPAAFGLTDVADPCIALNTRAQQKAPNAFAEGSPKPVLNWGQGAGKSYALTAVDIIAFDVLLCAVGRSARLTGFGLEDLGIPTQRTVQTNEYLETLYPNKIGRAHV